MSNNSEQKTRYRWATIRDGTSNVAAWFVRLRSPLPGLAIPIVLLGWAPAWFFLTCPILWNYMDGFLQVSTKPGPANLLVWPPLYCFGARLPMLIGYLTDGWTVKGVIRYFSHPVLVDRAILFLIFSQQLLLLIGSVVFIRAISKRTSVRIAIALIFSGFSFLYATEHTVGSEAGSVSLILLIAASSVHIARSGHISFRMWIWTNVLLCAAVLTRHINAVALLLPALTAALTPPQSSLGIERYHRRGLRFLAALAAGAIALVYAYCLVWILCIGARVDHRSMVGLTFLARIDQLRTVPGRFSEFANQMQNQLSDPVLAETLRRLKVADEAHDLPADFISAAKSTLTDVLSARGVFLGSRPLARVIDEKFNALTGATLLALPGPFREAVVTDWLQGQQWSSHLFTRCLISGTAIDWEHDPLSAKMEPLRNLATFRSQSFVDLKARATNFSGPFFADQVPVWQWVLICCILGVVSVALRLPSWSYVSAASMLLTGQLIYLLSCFIAGQVCRYGIPLLELVICAVLTQLAAILDFLVEKCRMLRTPAFSVS